MKYLKNCFVSIENITVRERMEACCLRLLSTIKFNFLVCRKGDGRLAAKPPVFPARAVAAMIVRVPAPGTIWNRATAARKLL